MLAMGRRERIQRESQLRFGHVERAKPARGVYA